MFSVGFDVHVRNSYIRAKDADVVRAADHEEGRSHIHVAEFHASQAAMDGEGGLHAVGWTEQDGERRFASLLVERVVNWQIAAELAIQVILFELRQDCAAPAPTRVGVSTCPAGRQAAMGIVVEMQGDAKLLLVVPATRGAGGFAGVLHRGEEQTDEDANDGNHHQQLHQRKAGFAARHVRDPKLGPSAPGRGRQPGMKRKL